jgi:cytochrome c peroxidase
MVACSALLLLAALSVSAQGPTLTPNEELGKVIFFDENLSINANQSCATCHTPEWGWTGTKSDINAHGAVYEGSIPGAFGDRKPPSAAYATQSPILHLDKGTWTGGNFWDGRATGGKLGNPAADQAQGPFLNPVEQALYEPADVVQRVCDASYGDLFRMVWGDEACDPANVYMAYDNIALSIAAYEASPEVNAFTSKFDYTKEGAAKLTKEEQKGYALFRGKGMCHRCHISNGQDPLFTDYTFDNLGIPKNPENPVYVVNPDFIDPGLGGFLEKIGYADFMAEWGKQKVPTLRNVDLRPAATDVKAYGHNGYFKTLEGIVNFYNTRDVKPTCPGDYTEAEALAAGCWPMPEVMANVNTAELGNLGLTADEEAAIVAFLKTLSDGYVPEK